MLNTAQERNKLCRNPSTSWTN